MATANFITTDNFPIVAIDDDTFEEMYFDYDDMVHDVESSNENLFDSLKFHKMKLVSGYYEGYQIVFEEIHNPEDMDNEDTQYYFDMCRSKAIRSYETEIHKINRFLKKLCKEGVWEMFGVVGRFSDGSCVYQKVS